MVTQSQVNNCTAQEARDTCERQLNPKEASYVPHNSGSKTQLFPPIPAGITGKGMSQGGFLYPITKQHVPSLLMEYQQISASLFCYTAGACVSTRDPRIPGMMQEPDGLRQNTFATQNHTYMHNKPQCAAEALEWKHSSLK